MALGRVFFAGIGLIAVLLVPVAAAETFADQVRTFDADRRRISQSYDLPWSPQRRERLHRLYQDWQQTVRQTDFSALDHDGRVD